MGYFIAGAFTMLLGIIIGFIFGAASVQSTIRRVNKSDV